MQPFILPPLQTATMTIQLVRAANLVLLFIIIASAHCYCLWYVAFMHLSLEVLNRQPVYLRHSFKIYNSIFWAYELVLVERLFQHNVSGTFEWMLNCAEHLGFAVIICLKIYIYTAVFFKPGFLLRQQRALIAVLLFNLIGVFNEVLQNQLCNRPLLVFTADCCKDIQVNLLGSLLFFLLVFIRTKNLKHTASMQ